MFFSCLLCFLVVVCKHSLCKPRISDLQQYCKWTRILQLPFLVICKSDWLLYKKRCSSVCACKNNLLVKCREGVKRYTSIAVLQGWRPLEWKPVLVMDAFYGTKLLQLLQNLEAQTSVYVYIYLYVCIFFFYSNLMYNIPIQM